jgi:hypothetical protein
MWWLSACTVQLNNPQAISQGMLAPDTMTSESPAPDEESFIPADHVRIHPSTDRTRINDSLTFTAEGGTPPYLFLMEEGTGTLNNLSGAFTAPGTPGYAVVGASDELGTSDRATVIFKDPPVLTPTPSTISVGNNLRIGAAGGSRPYIFSISTGADKATYDSSSGTLTALSVGTATLTLTDFDGESTSMTLNIVPALAMTPATQVLGFNGALTLTTTGGVTPLSYRIAAGGGTLSATSDSGATFNAPATTGASVMEVRDALGNTALALIETTPPLLLSPDRSLLPLGQTRDLVASGGSAPYNFAITSGGGSLLPSNSIVSYTAPATPGNATITVTDSKGLTASADVILHATLNFKIDAADVTTGETIQLTATGGVGTLSYSVISGSGSVDSNGLYTAPATPGIARIRVTDSAPTTPNTAEATLHILAPLNLSPATLSITSGATGNFGTTGGLPPYSYSLVSGGAGTGTINSETGAFTAGTTPGNLQVQVTDARSTTDTSAVTVVAPLLFTPESQTVLPESNTPLTTTGGLAPIALSIFAGPGTLSGADFIAPAGNGTTILKAQDSLGNVAYATLNSLIPLSILPDAVELPGNASLTFTADGGVPPYRFSLGEGSLGNIAPSSGLFLAPPGSGSAQVVVTDSTGATARATIGVLPDVRITSPATGTVAPTGVTLGGTCEIGLSVAIGGSGTTATQAISCTDGTYSTFVEFTTGDGPKSITASQTSGALTQTIERAFERVSPLPSGTSITLAAGATHISATSVAVTLSATDAADVYLTEVAGCASGGSWQTFSTNKNFNFSPRNATVTVYAKFRNAELNEGSCISDSILHDDIAPSFAVASPADNSLSQGSITATGTCEAGINIAVAGTGLGSATAISCGAGGTFSGSVGLSPGDGSKAVTYAQTDAAGNATSVSHTYTKDTAAPAAPSISPASGTVVGASETLSGTCDVGTTLLIAGSGITGGPHALNCAAGTYSQLLTFTAGSGGKDFSVTSTDAAGNSATATSSWTRDADSPALTLTSHTSGAFVQGSPTLSGACETGASTVSITGTGLASSPETTPCSTGVWSKSVTLSAGEGAKSLSATQSDSFSNTTTVNLNLIKDTTAPTLTFSPDPDGTVAQSSVNVAGTCETGITIAISGSGAGSPATLPCPAGSFSDSITLAGGDGSKSVTYTQTDAAGNAAAVTHSYTLLSPPAGLSYLSNSASYTKNQVITDNTPSSTGGIIATYSVSPSLPAGIVLDTSTGVISGTPTVLSASASYTVTATNSSGSTTRTLTLQVNDVPPSSLSYSNNAPTYTVGTPITDNSPTSSGGAVVAYAISPIIPAGLTFNTNTGVISGTPTTPLAESSFTVTATNTGGATTSSITLIIESSAPTQLAITGDSADAPDNCIALSLQTLDSLSNSGAVTQATAISISDGAGSGVFFGVGDDGCTGSPITSITFSTGDHTKEIYYKNAIEESVTLTVSRTSGDTLTGDTLALTLTAPTTSCCTDSAVTSVSGNILWLRAEDLVLANAASVSSWTDSSASANHAVQGTAANQPTFRTNVINGKPVVRFDGTNDWLTLSTNPSPPASHTVFTVLSTSTYASGNILFGGWSGSNAKDSWGILGTMTAPTCTGGLTFKFGDGTNSRVGACSGESQYLFPGNDVPVVIVYRYSAGASAPEVFVNGFRVKNPGSTSGTATSILGTAVPFSIGRGGSTANYYSDEDVAEFLIFDSALNDLNRINIEGYLMTKYGLGPKASAITTLPATGASTSLDTIGGSGSFKYSMFAGRGRINSSAQFVSPTSAGLSIVRSLDGSSNPDYVLLQTGSSQNDLKLWLKPEDLQQTDGTKVCRWPDSGPEGNHTWATSGMITRVCGGTDSPTFETNILNNRPVVRFVENGGTYGDYGQKLSAGTQISPPISSGYTIVGVASSTTLNASWQACLWAASGAANNATPYSWGLLQFNAAIAGSFRYLIHNSTGSGATRTQGTTDAAAFSATDTPYVVTQRHISGDSFDEIFINGSQQSTTASNSTYTDPQGGSPYFSVGGCGGYIYRFWEGDIAEVMVYDRNLSDSELAVINRYYSRKYGISIP